MSGQLITDTNFQLIAKVGLWDHKEQTVNHWFDGLSILTSFKIDASRGTVLMTKKFLNSEAYQKASAHGKLIVTGT